MRLCRKEDYLLLKAATRALITACGGLEGAATISRVGKTNLSDYGNPEKPDVFMPMDVALDLQKDSGNRSVVEALAALSGGSFTPQSDLAVHAGMAEAAAALMGETADVLKAIAKSQNDGQITPRERLDITIQVQQLIHACTATLSALCDNASEGDV